jgi:hypothetical protein
MTLAEARAIVGNQPLWALRNMVRALRLHSWLNTPEDCLRLAAAKLIIRNVNRSRKGK